MPPAPKDSDFAGLGQARETPGEFADHLVFFAPQGIQVDLGRREFHSVGGGIPGFGDDFRRVQEGFGGNAAHVQAHAADALTLFDEHHGLPEVGRAKGRGVAAGAAADYR